MQYGAVRSVANEWLNLELDKEVVRAYGVGKTVRATNLRLIGKENPWKT